MAVCISRLAKNKEVVAYGNLLSIYEVPDPTWLIPLKKWIKSNQT